MACAWSRSRYCGFCHHELKLMQPPALSPFHLPKPERQRDAKRVCARERASKNNVLAIEDGTLCEYGSWWRGCGIGIGAKWRASDDDRVVLLVGAIVASIIVELVVVIDRGRRGHSSSAVHEVSERSIGCRHQRGSSVVGVGGGIGCIGGLERQRERRRDGGQRRRRGGCCRRGAQ